MMLPCAFIPHRSLRERGAWSPFARKGRSLIPEFTDERCELGHKVASRLETQARRRPHQEADITTIELRVKGQKRKPSGLRPCVRFANVTGLRDGHLSGQQWANRRRH